MLFVAISAVNMGAKYCDQRVCLSVCPFGARISQKPHVHTFCTFLGGRDPVHP